jgi:hypothetical protein
MKEDQDNCVICPHSNAIKRTLDNHHKFARVLYAFANMNLDHETYHDYFNSVHVDEKWFFLTWLALSMYLVPGEAPPKRTTRHKYHILKVMFLAAVARPRYDGAGNCTFDGKIGMWPFVESVMAQRDSVQSRASTIEIKPVSVMAATYEQFLIGKVLPAIKRKWPERDRDTFIQQEGAPSHIQQTGPRLCSSCNNWKLEHPNDNPTSTISRGKPP